MPKPEKFAVGEMVRLKDLIAPDDIWNGQKAIVMSTAYTHPEHGILLVDIQVDDLTGWSVEPYNIERISPAEYEEQYDAYVDHRYLNPNGDGSPYDGRRVVKWSDCVWQPDRNFKRST